MNLEDRINRRGELLGGIVLGTAGLIGGLEIADYMQNYMSLYGYGEEELLNSMFGGSTALLSGYIGKLVGENRFEYMKLCNRVKSWAKGEDYERKGEY